VMALRGRPFLFMRRFRRSFRLPNSTCTFPPLPHKGLAFRSNRSMCVVVAQTCPCRKSDPVILMV